MVVGCLLFVMLYEPPSHQQIYSTKAYLFFNPCLFLRLSPVNADMHHGERL